LSKEINQKELKALIYLLEDPDNEVFQQISDKIISLGEAVIPQLENSWEEDFSFLKQSRIENIIHQIQTDTLSIKLKEWNLKKGSLKEGVFLVNSFHFPSLNITYINEKLKKIVKDIWLELNYDLTPIEQVNLINQILYSKYKLDFIEFESCKKSNLLIESVLNSKKGGNIILGLIYCLIADDLKIPIYGIILPDQFILARTTSSFDPNNGFPKDNDILFYINPNNGRIFDKKEISKYLNNLKTKKDKHYYIPSKNNKIIKQYIKELIYIHESENELNTVEKLWNLHDLL